MSHFSFFILTIIDKPEFSIWRHLYSEIILKRVWVAKCWQIKYAFPYASKKIKCICERYLHKSFMSLVQHGCPKFEYFQKSQAEMSFSCSCTQDINIISKDYIAIFQDNKILQESIFKKFQRLSSNNVLFQNIDSALIRIT